VAEDGVENAPYGHWTDEQFRHGIISEEVWRLYLHTGDAARLARYYPVMRGCAEWLVHDVLVRDERGRLKTRLITDADETVFPVRNSIFVACATVRCLQTTAQAAEILDLDQRRRMEWASLAEELRENLPLDETGTAYAYADDGRTPQGSHRMAMVFPFSFDVFGDRSKATLDRVYAAFGTGQRRTSWIWGIGRLCAAFFYQGRGDEGYDMLRHALVITGPFLAPSEHLREDGRPYLPWFATGAGAYVHAVHAMFVQVVDEQGAVLLHGLPQSMQQASFHGLLASHGVVVSGSTAQDQLLDLVARSPKPMTWEFRLPTRFAWSAGFAQGVRVSESLEHGLATITCTLTEGDNRIVE
jgi:hypothetical protein